MTNKRQVFNIITKIKNKKQKTKILILLFLNKLANLLIINFLKL